MVRFQPGEGEGLSVTNYIVASMLVPIGCRCQ
jgi:hypothetical protein